MINLVQYRQYWEGVARRVDAITGVLPVTIDDEMAKKITSLARGSVTLFFLPPAAESSGKNPDAFREDNECVIFVMEKFDPQRRTAYSVLESSQPVMERIKDLMLDDQAAGCPVMRFDVSSLTTIPETKFYAGFAGWSLGFRINS